MKIEVSGCVCLTCNKYTQYYARGCEGDIRAIDCGYCGMYQRRTRPGNRCKYYTERSNIGVKYA